ncbi:MAG: glycosyltransferase family 2 protein [Coprobacter sp.]|nr:glycosyltransferase family 2 protein [Coprobacter sp.]
MFSIIIPVYNVAPYIRKCLDSVLTQDVNDWEALLIDDGSTDGSGSVCDEYAGRDSRFRVFHKTNGGVSSARNMGLDNARGEWVWYVDPDDWLAEDALTFLADAVNGKNCDTVFFGIEYYDESTALMGCEDRESIVDRAKDETIILGDYPPQNYLLKREIIEKHHLRFSDGIPVGEDLEYQYKYLMVCQNPISIDKRLYKCLRRSGSAMRNSETLDCMAKYSPVILEHLVSFISENGIAETTWLAARLTRTFKAVMSSNYVVGKYRNGLQHRLRVADKCLKSMGFRTYADWAVKVGVTDLRLYYGVQYLRKWMKQ